MLIIRNLHASIDGAPILQGLDLTIKTMNKALFPGEGCGEFFDGDDLIGLLVPGQVDVGHATGTDPFLNQVRSNTVGMHCGRLRRFKQDELRNARENGGGTEYTVIRRQLP